MMQVKQMINRLPLSAVLLMALSLPASAHSAPAPAAELLAGFLHPFSGLDHVVAMVALGIWAAVLGARFLWLLPAVFIFAMAVGGLLGYANAPLPLAETLVLASALLLTALALGRIVLRDGMAVAVTAVFAIAHGHIHAAELPAHVSAPVFAAGFLMASAALHVCGIILAYLTSRTEVRARRATS